MTSFIDGPFSELKFLNIFSCSPLFINVRFMLDEMTKLNTLYFWNTYYKIHIHSKNFPVFIFYFLNGRYVFGSFFEKMYMYLFFKTYVYQKMAFWKSAKINVSWIVYLEWQDCWGKVQILKDYLHFLLMLLLLKHD